MKIFTTERLNQTLIFKVNDNFETELIFKMDYRLIHSFVSFDIVDNDYDLDKDNRNNHNPSVHFIQMKHFKEEILEMNRYFDIFRPKNRTIKRTNLEIGLKQDFK